MNARHDFRWNVINAADQLNLPLTVTQAYELADRLEIQTALAATPRISPGTSNSLLTKQQFEALAALADGESCRDAGSRLGRTEASIRNRRRSLYRRLGARSGSHAVAIAIRLGVLAVSSEDRGRSA